jgi:hypothetical protein
VYVHKIASSTANHIADHMVDIAEGGRVRPGDVVVVKALEEKRVYDQLELSTGRLAHISKDDLIAGALGSRHALRGFVGYCPEVVKTGAVLNVLNLGGVIGLATSANEDVGHPLRVKVLGLAQRDGKTLNIAEGGIPPADKLEPGLPIILVAGTCMGAGKTRAAVEIISQLNQRGFKLGGMKLSGVAALRDTLNMLDHGARAAKSFLDAGYPSTAGFRDLAPMARGLINAMKSDQSDLDAVVIEMGDGIIGGYAVDSFYHDDQLREAIKVHVMSATDLVAAWGAREVSNTKLKRPIDVMTGPATDNTVGEAYVEDHLDVPAANARTRGEKLGDMVAMKCFERETNR